MSKMKSYTLIDQIFIISFSDSVQPKGPQADKLLRHDLQRCLQWDISRPQLLNGSHRPQTSTLIDTPKHLYCACNTGTITWWQLHHFFCMVQHVPGWAVPSLARLLILLEITKKNLACWWIEVNNKANLLCLPCKEHVQHVTVFTMLGRGIFGNLGLLMWSRCGHEGHSRCLFENLVAQPSGQHSLGAQHCATAKGQSTMD